MRRTLNWFVVLLSAAFLFAATLMSGCGGGGGAGIGSDNPPLSADGMLRPVRDAAELEKVLKRKLQQAIDQGAPAGPINLPTTTVEDFSQTYVLERGVDELDFTRYDGRYLYVATARSWYTTDAAIRILRTDPATATATEVGSIPLWAEADKPRMLMGMYVSADRLFLISTDAYYGAFGDVWITMMPWAPTEFRVEVHDVHDPAHPRQLLSANIDGVFVDSRRIGDRVVVVSRHTPGAVLDSAKRARIALTPLAELLPGMVLNGKTRPLVEPQDCYVANAAHDADPGDPTLTSITTFSMSNPGMVDGICYDQAANGVYASQDAVYVSEPVSDPAITNTRIHKFSLQGAHAEYSGSAEVPGLVWAAGQADFRMSEAAGLLRVMTTNYTSDPADFTEHELFVLRQKPGAHALEIVGRLPNDARPAEIGKPNEQLFAVRFAGDRAYAVTFRSTDPLYVLDLSDPADPRIAGELELPGLSTFLHPVSDHLLLGLGSDPTHLKLELFDTSVLEQPQSRGAITLADGAYSSSAALYDRHAFTYLPGESADQFAIPAWVMSYLPGQQQPNVVWGLHQFEILGKDTPSSALLQQAGVVVPPDPEGVTPVVRSFIDDGAVYTIREGGQVWGTLWSTPSQLNGPF